MHRNCYLPDFVAFRSYVNLFFKNFNVYNLCIPLLFQPRACTTTIASSTESVAVERSSAPRARASVLRSKIRVD